MKISRQDLLMLWRFSRFESVREVAHNPDILKLILTELEPMFQYNRVVTEYNDPRYKAHFKRLFTASRNNDEIHPDQSGVSEFGCARVFGLASRWGIVRAAVPRVGVGRLRFRWL